MSHTGHRPSRNLIERGTATRGARNSSFEPGRRFHRERDATLRFGDERIEYDLSYLRNWSLQLDLQIVLKTILVVLRPQNAH
jgi:lipopolysaccharide/colanic/teichoic acid biosynthesis glycosyltransferase